mmetsp:Transcript_23953/g.73794  ORF Transcript_23953/g.73794 Transcript_23953/m.73794 type:complete len:116 (-) Transcript_23953:221-568(-)
MVVISGAHTQIWSKDAEADRAFLRDVLGLPSTGGHWPIFGLPPSSIAVHPSEDSERHEVYFLCDDVEAFIAEMTAKGIECSPAKDVGFGILTTIVLPGGGKVAVYKPKHARPDNP